MTERDEAIARVARAHGLSEGAVAALWEAMARGGGRMAQFSHPDLGGMGQWSGGMLQIGDMFNHALKVRVAAACADIAGALATGPAAEAGASAAAPARTSVPRTGAPAMLRRDGDWWPGDLGSPSASGAQNGSRYAYFADRQRLAVAHGGAVTLYDTGHHRISGVSQAQSRGSDLAFTSQDGTVDIAALRIVEA